MGNTGSAYKSLMNRKQKQKQTKKNQTEMRSKQIN